MTRTTAATDPPTAPFGVANPFVVHVTSHPDALKAEQFRRLPGRRAGPAHPRHHRHHLATGRGVGFLTSFCPPLASVWPLTSCK